MLYKAISWGIWSIVLARAKRTSFSSLLLQHFKLLCTSDPRYIKDYFKKYIARVYCDDSCANSGICTFQNELIGYDFIPPFTDSAALQLQCLMVAADLAGHLSRSIPPWSAAFVPKSLPRHGELSAWLEGAQPPHLSVCKGPCLPPEVPQLAFTCSWALGCVLSLCQQCLSFLSKWNWDWSM